MSVKQYLAPGLLCVVLGFSLVLQVRTHAKRTEAIGETCATWPTARPPRAAAGLQALSGNTSTPVTVVPTARVEVPTLTSPPTFRHRRTGG